jgi:AraC-like DNA-binding protein
MPLADLVRHDSSLGRWELARWQPAPPLQCYIEELWHMRSEGSYTRERLLPRAHMDLLINLGEPHRLVSSDRDRPSRLCERAWIAGLQDTYLDIESPSHPWLMGIRFKPCGPLGLLRVPLADLANQVVDLDLILGPSIERLRERVVASASVESRFDLLERYLLDRMAAAARPRAEVSHALGRLAGTCGAVRMRTLASETGISQKHLIDLFREQVGMAPKRYARIVRLNALLRGLSSSPWADLAARFGYYDQAHLVRDFREFSGTTPTEFLRARGPDGDSIVLEPQINAD